MGDVFGPGARFGGSDGERFVVESRAGKGGQAEVFRCQDSRLHRAVALKVCTAPDGTNRKLYLDRFEHELRMTSGVQHPHVLQVFDCGELPSGQPYVILEWMEHGSLADLVRRQRETGRYLPLPYVRYYATAMAAGLRAAHTAQLVHRDVKPDNVLIAKDGVAKLTDFGIAKDLSVEAPQLTAIGQTLGTLGFMANEQLKGLPGPQSDIFSWGISVFCLLQGRLPAQRQANTIPLGILEESALDGVPRAFLPILRLALAADLSERYASFTEVLADLAAMDLNGADDRPLFPPTSLPILPTNAFVSGFTTSNAVPPVPRPGQPGGLETSAGTASGNDLGLDGYGDTEDVQAVTADAGAPGIQPTLMLDAQAPKVNTGATTRVPEPVADARETPGPTRAQIEAEPGPTRVQTLETSYLEQLGDAPTASRRGPALVGAAVAVVAVIGLAVMLLRSPAPDAATEAAAALEYGAALLRGDPAAASAAGARLGASAAERPAGRVIQAWDALIAGRSEDARTLAQPLTSEPDPVGASAAAIVGAALRRSGPERYSEAVLAQRQAAACAACGELRDAAARAVAQDCYVLGPSADGCAQHLDGLSERDAGLLAAAVLLDDGHPVAARARIEGALALPGEASCVQTRVLRAFALAQPALSSPTLLAARRDAARDASDCANP